jgi:hypothetical protein
MAESITVKLEITSEVDNFIKQILSLLADGGSSIVKILNQTSFHMRRMVRVEVEISASVCDFCRQCRPFPDDRSIQKDIRTV